MVLLHHARSVLRRRLWLFCVSGCLLLAELLAVSQAHVRTTITPDSSLGTTVTPQGNVFAITGGTRPGNGPNLFHSFGQFTLGTNDTSRFTGPAEIANILSRVTGTQPSMIDGRLQSTIPGAHLFLLNPHGVMFGPNASLDIGGSFHVSTADYLRLADGARFSAHRSETSTFSVASPAAFGFLGPTPAPITIQGSTLRVAEGQTLSVIGGDLTMVGNFSLTGVSTLRASHGRINLASVASAGEVVLNPVDQPPALQVDTFARLGRIDVSDARINASGNGRGTVIIRGGRLLLNGSFIATVNLGDVDGTGTGIDIEVTGEVAITNGGLIETGTAGAGRAGDIRVKAGQLALVDGSQIFTATTGVGRAGDVQVQAGRLSLTGGATIDTSTFGAGLGGNVTITATDTIAIAGQNNAGLRSGVTSFAVGDGSAGRVLLMAPTISVDGGLIGTSSVAATMRAGPPGDVQMQAGRLSLIGGATIDTSTRGPGRGGTVTLTATDTITIAGQGSAGISTGIPSSVRTSTSGAGAAGRVSLMAPTVSMDGGHIEAATTGVGRAGDVQVQAGHLSLTGGAVILGNTSGSGSGGTVTITATESMSIAGRDSTGMPSGMFSRTSGVGDAGRVAVSSPQLAMADGGQIGAETGGDGRGGDVVVQVGSASLSGGAQINSGSGISGGDRLLVGAGAGGTVTVTATDLVTLTGQGSGFSTQTMGQGQGGDITLQARQLKLNDGAVISAESTGAGNAGNLTIMTSNPFLSMQSTVSTKASQADGGDIHISTPAMVRLRDSAITAEVGGGPQTVGGNVTIDPRFVLLQNSQIVANAFEGHGGNIRISAQQVFLADPTSQVSASSALGINGQVDIRAPVTSISGTVAPLPQTFARAAELLRDRCAERLRGGTVSRFVLGGRDGVPLEPGSLLLSPLDRAGQGRAASAVEERHEVMVVNMGVLGLNNTEAKQAPGSLDVECARWMGKQGTTVTHTHIRE